MLRAVQWAACLCLLHAGCTPETKQPLPTDAALETRDILGYFEDDYGIQYEITDSTWTQFPSSVYHIDEWNDAEQFLIAQNDSMNSSGAGLWTRIDWMTLEGMALEDNTTAYDWAFCLSAYEAQSKEEAKSSLPADRATPRTGCAGHPFSRMKTVHE